MKEYFLILISAALVNNFVLVRFLGICPFLGVSKKTETAIGMGFAVMFVMTLASFITYTVQIFFLNPTASNIFYKIMLSIDNTVSPNQFDFRYLQTVIFILTIASLVQLTEMVIKKFSPVLYKGLGIFLPLITTNCAVLGVAILNVQETDFNLVKAVFHGFGAALGFTLALILMSGLREKFELNDIPKPLQGAAIALVTAGILSLCFMGFSGI